MSIRRIHQIFGLGLTMIGLCSSSFADTYSSSGLPTGVTNPIATPQPSLWGTPTQPAVCPNQTANVQTGSQNNLAILQQMLASISMSQWDKRDKAGDQEEEKWDREETRKYTAAVNAQFGTGCQNFFSKDGKVMPWGQTAISEIRKRSTSFIERTPRDITTYCPKYKSFDEGTKERFWTWTLMSMASSESSCQPGAKAWAVNGYAKGLFQMDEGVCNNYELTNPHGNVECAVRRLAKELDNRGTLMSECSALCRDKKDATHWGVLRVDDQHKARGGDIIGAQKTRALIKKFDSCN